MNPLMQLKSLGQSVWYANLLSGLVPSDGLKRMMEEYGINGASVGFKALERAVTGTSAYDQEIKVLASKGHGPRQAAFELLMKEARSAAKAFEGLYKNTMAGEGLVCVPIPAVDPSDPESIINEALRLRSVLDLPNLVFMLPATDAGIKAIEALVSEGCAVEASGVCTIKKAEEAFEAYLKGLDRRLASGKTLGGCLATVSFMVGGLDALADGLIEQRAGQSRSKEESVRLKNLLGKCAIASARLIRRKYAEASTGKAFSKYRAKGAHPMRLVWEDTMVRDQRYPDAMYIDSLVMEGTISRMSFQSIVAYYGHGRPRLSAGHDLEEAEKTLAELAALSIDLSSAGRALEEETAHRRACACRELTDAVESKMASLNGQKKDPGDFFPGEYALSIDSAIKRLGEERVLERLWKKDPTLWKDTPSDSAVIKKSLGWLSVVEFMNAVKGPVMAFASDVRSSGFKDAVLLGMGGSSLAPMVLGSIIDPEDGFPRLHVLDSTDPGAVASIDRQIDAENTLFIVSSKSGSTIEPLSLFEHFYSIVKAKKGEKAGENFVAITEAGTALDGYGKKYGFRRVFLNPVDIGGRFSALSYFGLVPAAVSGIDISRLLRSALIHLSSIQPFTRPEHSSAARLGAVIATLAMKGRDKLTFILPERLISLGLWMEQLIAESTGKEAKGIVPITGERALEPSWYGNDRAFVSIKLGDEDPGAKRFIEGLKKLGHPVITLKMNDAYDTGAEFLRWEAAVAVAGHVMGLNPFDQPDVELSKKLTVARLNSGMKKTALKPPGVPFEAKGFDCSIGKAAMATMKQTKKGMDGLKALKGFIGLADEGDYIGLLAYCDPFDRDMEKRLVRLKGLLAEATGCPVQFGYGPRYLHSTGQLHKGGPDTGVFLIICHASKEDIPIPESPFSFSELELSQAFGDMEALDSKGRRVALLMLPDQRPASLDQVISSVEAGI